MTCAGDDLIQFFISPENRKEIGFTVKKEPKASGVWFLKAKQEFTSRLGDWDAQNVKAHSIILDTCNSTWPSSKLSKPQRGFGAFSEKNADQLGQQVTTRFSKIGSTVNMTARAYLLQQRVSLSSFSKTQHGSHGSFLCSNEQNPRPALFASWKTALLQPQLLVPCQRRSLIALHF
ncbi:hypothetical protein K470DRAFT_24141 [Piedraia hortae CBS 480.64]|uniref:Uncharacterized protein n=1 Tax=Piedraia hortae CBS 480.64 TaxID=1314780 RepID=A0A6A7C3N0_9PEZI|nr:hypothetical protein K470DRAFT_24141 [Piedraia hortae CBS 480.64]